MGLREWLRRNNIYFFDAAILRSWFVYATMYLNAIECNIEAKLINDDVKVVNWRVIMKGFIKNILKISAVKNKDFPPGALHR